MAATVADVLQALERIAPFGLAETWDNCGLQIGAHDWPARRIAVALDPAPGVLEKAVQDRIGVLVTHHPLIFNPLRVIDAGTPLGGMIQKALRHRLAILAVHTNLDAAAGGLNDILASMIDLQEAVPLTNAAAAGALKLVFFVPVEHEARLMKALAATPAGEIGRYTSCSFRGSGKGVFRPAAGAAPFSGEIDALTEIPEVRIETVLRPRDLKATLAVLAAEHPYEEMAYDVYPLVPPQSSQGMGRIGSLAHPVDLIALAQFVKEKIGLHQVRVVGDPALMVSKVAVCTGSGSGLLTQFLASDAQVYVSGDMKYHDARNVEDAGKGLIDIGHFPSEHLMVDALATGLQQEFARMGVKAAVHPLKLEKDPFYLV